MPEDESVPEVPASEIAGIADALIHIMSCLRDCDEKGISARAFCTALIYTLQTSFEVFGMSKLEVKNVLQGVINTYQNEENDDLV